MGLGTTRNREILGYSNRGDHWNCLPEELPRTEHQVDGVGELKSLRAQAASQQGLNYCTGVLHLAYAFGDSTAWERNGWPCKLLVFLIPEEAIKICLSFYVWQG